MGTWFVVGIDNWIWNSRAAGRVNIMRACRSPTMRVAVENGMLALTCAGGSPGLSYGDLVEEGKGSPQHPPSAPHNYGRMPPP